MGHKLIALSVLVIAMFLSVDRTPARSITVNTSPAIVASSIIADLPLFATEDSAQRHCPKDTVVWLNTRSGIYHLKGERWYGRTKHGAYVCKKEADMAGDRETENGQ
jgi:hypothetical protein